MAHHGWVRCVAGWSQQEESSSNINYSTCVFKERKREKKEGERKKGGGERVSGKAWLAGVGIKKIC